MIGKRVYALLLVLLVMVTAQAWGAVGSARFTKQLYIVETEGEEHSFSAYAYKNLIGGTLGSKQSEKENLSLDIQPVYSDPVQMPTDFADNDDAIYTVKQVFAEEQIKRMLSNVIGYASKHGIDSVNIFFIYRCHIDNKPKAIILHTKYNPNMYGGWDLSKIVTYLPQTSGYIISDPDPVWIKITYISHTIGTDAEKLGSADQIRDALNKAGLLGKLIIDEMKLDGTLNKRLVDTVVSGSDFDIPANESSASPKLYISKIIDAYKDTIQKDNPLYIVADYFNGVTIALDKYGNPKLNIKVTAKKLYVVLKPDSPSDRNISLVCDDPKGKRCNLDPEKGKDMVGAGFGCSTRRWSYRSINYWHVFHIGSTIQQCQRCYRHNMGGFCGCGNGFNYFVRGDVTAIGSVYDDPAIDLRTYYMVRSEQWKTVKDMVGRDLPRCGDLKSPVDSNFGSVSNYTCYIPIGKEKKEYKRVRKRNRWGRWYWSYRTIYLYKRIWVVHFITKFCAWSGGTNGGTWRYYIPTGDDGKYVLFRMSNVGGCNGYPRTSLCQIQYRLGTIFKTDYKIGYNLGGTVTRYIVSEPLRKINTTDGSYYDMVIQGTYTLAFKDDVAGAISNYKVSKYATGNDWKWLQNKIGFNMNRTQLENLTKSLIVDPFDTGKIINLSKPVIIKETTLSGQTVNVPVDSVNQLPISIYQDWDTPTVVEIISVSRDALW